MNFASLIILAMIGEAVWETLKMIWENGKASIDRIGALLVALLLCIGTGTDLMEMVGIPMHIPFAGMILTALLISRGSNFVHDILQSINSLQQKTKVSR